MGAKQARLVRKPFAFTNWSQPTYVRVESDLIRETGLNL
jgi:hypothetical protein